MSRLQTRMAGLTRSLHTTPDGRRSSASRATVFGPACVSSIVRSLFPALFQFCSARCRADLVMRKSPNILEPRLRKAPDDYCAQAEMRWEEDTESGQIVTTSFHTSCSSRRDSYVVFRGKTCCESEKEPFSQSHDYAHHRHRRVSDPQRRARHFSGIADDKRMVDPIVYTLDDSPYRRRTSLAVTDQRDGSQQSWHRKSEVYSHIHLYHSDETYFGLARCSQPILLGGHREWDCQEIPVAKARLADVRNI